MTEGFVEPAADTVAAALAAIGIDVDPATLDLLNREDRIAVILPPHRIAWLPTNPNGRRRLAQEARVLALLADHCGFAVPTVLRDTPDLQLRTLVEGETEPWRAYQRVRSDEPYARALGTTLGKVLADQHDIPIALLDWLPRVPSWPEPYASLAAALPHVTGDQELIARALALIERHEAMLATTTTRVITHGDFGLHNFAFAADGSLAGVFDYDAAALLDRHHDFAYLVFDREDETLFEAAVAAYGAAGGQPIDPRRVHLLNAAAAVGFLAFRAGSGPDDKPAGRTLAEDLAWTRLALDRAG